MWGIFEDIFFLCDIVLNFHTAYFDDGVLVIDPKRVRAHYCRGTLLLDFAAALPVDYIALGVDDGESTSLLRASKALRILRLFRLVRLFRLSRLFRYLGRYEEQFNSNYIRMAKMFFMLLLFSHWNGCLLFLAASLEGFDPNSWVSLNGLVEADLDEQYSNSVFNSLSHMLCIGYGRFPPQLLSEVWVTIWSMLSGASLFAGIIGAMSALMLNADTSGAQFRARSEELRQYLIKYDIPEDIRMRAWAHFRGRWEANKLFNEDVVEDLPLSMQRELQVARCRKLIDSMWFFEGAEPAFIAHVASHLRWQLLLRDEVVIQEHSPPSELFFIAVGEVGLYFDGAWRATFTEGSYFGEFSLLWGHKQPLTVRTTQDSEFFVMSEEDFHDIMADYPDTITLMKEVAKERIRRLNIPAGWVSRGDAALGRDKHEELQKVADLSRAIASTPRGSMISVAAAKAAVERGGSQLSLGKDSFAALDLASRDASFVVPPDVTLARDGSTPTLSGDSDAKAVGSSMLSIDVDADAAGSQPSATVPGLSAPSRESGGEVTLTPAEVNFLRTITMRLGGIQQNQRGGDELDMSGATYRHFEDIGMGPRAARRVTNALSALGGASTQAPSSSATSAAAAGPSSSASVPEDE